MAVGANSYGTSADVAALTPRYAAKGVGDFDAGTNPTQARVEALIDNVSAIANGCLANLGFSIPVTDADAILIVKQLVTEIVAVMVEGIRGTGRYAPNSKAIQARGLMTMVYQDVCETLSKMAFGLEQLGAVRSADEAGSIGYRPTDESGDETFPIFQRKGFGNRFTEWDSN